MATKKISRRTNVHASTITAAQLEKMTVVQQIRRAFARGARVSALMGLAIGSLFPVFSFVLIHFEVKDHPLSWIWAGAALIMSFKETFNWFSVARSSKVLGFFCAIALEGIMSGCHIFALSVVCLLVLVFVNAVGSAVGFQVRKDVA
jgi:hypothetical protein